jgi:hypothetical protein
MKFSPGSQSAEGPFRRDGEANYHDATEAEAGELTQTPRALKEARGPERRGVECSHRNEPLDLEHSFLIVSAVRLSAQPASTTRRTDDEAERGFRDIQHDCTAS